jgi:hypothetical protein
MANNVQLILDEIIYRNSKWKFIELDI